MEAVVAMLCIAAEQHGAVSVAQAREVGFSARAQRAAIDHGWVRIAAPGVLVIAGSEDSWFQRLQVGLLVLRGQGWVSHESAAALYRFDRCLNGEVHLTVRRGWRRGPMPEWMVLHTTAFVGRTDLVTVAGFRCTSATRTILDLATLGISRRRLEAAVDTAVRDGRSALVVLAARLAELRGSGRAGVRTIDRILPDTGGHTMLERDFLRLLRRNGLVRPTTQRVIRRSRKHVARVDFIYDDRRLVIEVTGRKGHVSDAERERDAQRRNELQDLGYRVFEYTSTEVRDRPRYVVDTMRARLNAPFTWAEIDQIG